MQRSIENFKKILSSYDNFSRLQRKIADYITSNLGEVVFMSISSLAGTLGVSEATIVRFAQELGYSGFPELKDDLIKYYRYYLNPAERIRKYIGDVGKEEITYKIVTQKEIKFLEDSISTVNEHIFHNAIDKICNAKTVYIFGTGSNGPLASHLAYRLSRFSLNIHLISVSGRNIFEHLLRLTSDDFAVVYAFYKPSVDFKRLMAVFKDNDITSLLITDTLTPPMIKNASMVLYAKRGPFGSFHSPLVPMAITNALIIGVASKLGDKAIDSLKKLEELREKYYSNGLSFFDLKNADDSRMNEGDGNDA